MTISRLAARFGLSRSTLLYYDRIGLLRPSGRTAAGYRTYSERDVSRLEQICVYRNTGLRLGEIQRLLGAPRSDAARALERQLRELSDQIESLRSRQRLIARLLGKPRLLERLGPMNRETWTRLLAAAGLDEAAMRQWHRNFERGSPREHQRFLEFLNIPDEDIARIRRWSRQSPPGTPEGADSSIRDS